VSQPRPRPVEGILERMARNVVAEHLDVQVARLDDGMEQSMPDGLIFLADGRTAPLEVVSDHDVRWLGLSDALEKRGSTLDLDPTTPAWFLTLWHDANLKLARARLPELLRSLPAGVLDDGAFPADSWAAGEKHAETLEVISRLGVSYLRSIAEVFGRAEIRTHGWDSWEDPVTLLPWIGRVFEQNDDVPRKLLRAGGAERHAFIWATIGSAYLVTDALSDVDELDDDDLRPGPHPELLAQLFASSDVDAGEPLPDPTLPDGVTHLWVASTLSNKRALYWSPDGGWTFTGWRTPAHEDDIDARVGAPGES